MTQTQKDTIVALMTAILAQAPMRDPAVIVIAGAVLTIVNTVQVS